MYKYQLTKLLLVLVQISLCNCQDWGIYHDSEEAERIDELNDGKILEDVLVSIGEWKDRQQRKFLHQLFHSRQKRDEEVVCYGDLGCFRDEGPFNYLDMLPSPPEEIRTVFYLYTLKNKEIPQVLEYNNITTVSQSNFNASAPTKIIIHGFGSSCNKIWPREMRLSFLAVEDCNVICVDWAAGAVDPNYVRAAVNTRLVGKQVALLIDSINNEGITINNNTHLVGFSLGAHVSGFVGKELKNLSRITGLDPAGPLFEGYSPKVRLDKTDADYVDVIHSNGDSLIIGGLGAWEPIGHVDFYPNGGRAQRGCQNLLIGGLYDFIYSYSTKNESYRYLCNHRRAYKLFTDSISPKCKFTAFPCDSYEKFESGQCFTCNSEVGECGELGYRSNQSPGRGSLYLLTREEEPFCANQYKINLMFTGSRLPLYTYGALQMKLINQNGINETFTLTSTHDELLTSGAKIEKLIVAHPALDDPIEIQILYIAYEGWIYSGRYQWSIDKLTITDGFGKKRSFCKEQGELLPSGIPVAGKLKIGDCISSSPPFPKPEFTEKFSPKKPSANLRPPYPNDISKQSHHVDLSEPNLSNFVTDIPPIKPDVIINNMSPITVPENADFDLATIPKPLLVPIEPQATLVNLPNKPLQHHQYQSKHDFGINSHVKKTQVWKNKFHSHRPPLQPFHLQGPPGAWSIVTSKPGSLPPPIHVYQSKFSTSKPTNNNGIELQYGPKLPLPPLPPNRNVPNPFPGRRRPSTSGHHPYRKPLPQIDMTFAESGTTLAVSPSHQSSTEKLQPATERIDVLREEDIIVIDDVKQVKIRTNTSSPVKTDILSDDQLTIFKVGPDNDVERVVNMSSFDQNVTDTESLNYKYVILHKLPNGEAVNLENLKTYNYEDLINGYSSFVDDGPTGEEFDRENLEYFDVPRKFTNKENPYIIYQLSEPSLQNTRGESNKYFKRPNGIYPVYKPTTLSTSSSSSTSTSNPLSNTVTRKSPVFIPKLTKQNGISKSEGLSLSKDDMKLLQTKVEEILSEAANHTDKSDDVSLPNHNHFSNENMFETMMSVSFETGSNRVTNDNAVRQRLAVKGKPSSTGNDWVPTDSRVKELPRNNPSKLRSNQNDESELNIQKLSKLSQLASVSITDNGPLADTVKSIKEENSNMRTAQKLTIQLLPPRLSAVLTHLEPPAPTRSQNSRSILSGFRQNKIAPVFKNPRNQDNKLRNLPNNRKNYARRISNGEYIITHPYQTQVIPKEEKSRFIPLAPPHKSNKLWWHPSQPSVINRPHVRHPVFNQNTFRDHHRRNNQYNYHPQMSNNLKAPPSLIPDSHPIRPVTLPLHTDSNLVVDVTSLNIQAKEAANQATEQVQNLPNASMNNIRADHDRKQLVDLYDTGPELQSTTLSTFLNRHQAVKSFPVNITEEMIEKNLEKINTLERAATHIQQPFLPSLSKETYQLEYQNLVSSTTPVSGGLSNTLNISHENVTFSTPDTNNNATDNNAVTNVSMKVEAVEATPAVAPSRVSMSSQASNYNTYREHKLRTISDESKDESERSSASTNHVPTFYTPLKTQVHLENISNSKAKNPDHKKEIQLNSDSADSSSASTSQQEASNGLPSKSA